MKTETEFRGSSGYGILSFVLIALVLCVVGIVLFQAFWTVGFLMVLIIMLPGFYTVQPNESSVMTLFGEYKGTAKDNGFFWANPFFTKARVSLRARNLESQPLKVNDKLGNPIMIGIILVWRVADTFRAAFEVDDYENFVKKQAE